ncbi:hypothetical protein ACHHYP_08063 [Achlya hypogyna]|uniref:Uncharacterized protein n=1 Tax=Achlya hypogyna TaxID=1202772 RepID=A0A1V9YQ06_ACHHY|nr:hypothetical protein ACHHYP_08063 [Achlya hypogyna]
MLPTSPYVVLYAISGSYGLFCTFLGYSYLGVVALGLVVLGYLALATFSGLNFSATMILLVAVASALVLVYRRVQVQHASVLHLLGKGLLNMATIVLVGTFILATVENSFAAYATFAVYIGIDVFVSIRYTERIRVIVVTSCLGAIVAVGAASALWLDDMKDVQEASWLPLMIALLLCSLGVVVQSKTTKEPPATLLMSRSSTFRTHISEIPTPTAQHQWVNTPYTEFPLPSAVPTDDRNEPLSVVVETLSATANQVGAAIVDLSGNVVSATGELDGDEGSEAAQVVRDMLLDCGNLWFLKPKTADGEQLERITVAFPDYQYIVTADAGHMYIVKTVA